MNSRQAKVIHQNDIGMRIHIVSPTVPQPEQYGISALRGVGNYYNQSTAAQKFRTDHNLLGFQ